ncbi:MAG TPA: hypothetical protein VGI35_09160, partial [Steroidobacteraceae bacterium]
MHCLNGAASRVARSPVALARAVLAAGALVLVLVAQPVRAEAGGSPFTIQDLVRLRRVSGPVVSPDGRHVVFEVRETDVPANRGRTHLWMLDLT